MAVRDRLEGDMAEEPKSEIDPDDVIDELAESRRAQVIRIREDAADAIKQKVRAGADADTEV